MTTHKIETTQAQFEIKVNGQTLIVDFAKMHPTWVAHFLLKAAQRRLNDDLSGLDPAAKLDETRMMLHAIHNGEEFVATRRASGSVTSVDPVTKLTRDNAKLDLKAVFVKATGKGKIADWVAVPAIAAFFKEDGKTWNEESVDKFIAKKLGEGKDYRAEAEATLAIEGEGADLLADLM